MIQRAEDKEFFLIFVPITAQAPKNCRTIIKRMRGNTNLRLRVWDNLALEMRVWAAPRNTSNIKSEATEGRLDNYTATNRRRLDKWVFFD